MRCDVFTLLVLLNMPDMNICILNRGSYSAVWCKSEHALTLASLNC